MANNAPSSKKTGTVKWYNRKRGFGFITPDDGDDDVFVHRTAFHAEGESPFRFLREGESVQFFCESGEDGRRKALTVMSGRNGRGRGGRRGAAFVGAGGSDRRCYNCGEAGHFARDCSSEDKRRCYHCRGVGHIARDCTS